MLSRHDTCMHVISSGPERSAEGNIGVSWGPCCRHDDNITNVSALVSLELWTTCQQLIRNWVFHSPNLSCFWALVFSDTIFLRLLRRLSSIRFWLQACFASAKLPSFGRYSYVTLTLPYLKTYELRIQLLALYY